MLAPGGILLHNEARLLVGDVTMELNIALVHARSAVIATVRGAANPLFDGIFLHAKAR